MVNFNSNSRFFHLLVAPLVALFPRLAESHASDKGYRKFKTLPHLLLTIFAQLLQVESANALLEELNDYTLPKEGRNLRQLIGFEGEEDGEPRRLHQSSFSRANTNRSYQVWQACFQHLLDYAKARYPARLAGLGKVVAVDGTLFDCLARMAWAVYRTTKNKVKGHYFLDLNGIPDKLVLTTGKGSETEILATHFRAGITYIFDRGYNDYSLFRQMTEQTAFFVTRLKAGAIVNGLTNLPVSLAGRTFGIISDQKVRLGQADNTVELRLVVWRGLDGEPWSYLTNRLDLSAQLIVELYNYRWQIEIV